MYAEDIVQKMQFQDASCSHRLAHGNMSLLVAWLDLE